jgi:hypothetical protein
MIVSPYCELHDMALRLLTTSHCKDRNSEKCASGECEHFGMRFYKVI